MYLDWFKHIMVVIDCFNYIMIIAPLEMSYKDDQTVAMVFRNIQTCFCSCMYGFSCLDF